MSYTFPPEIQHLIDQNMATGMYASQDDVLQAALQVLSDGLIHEAAEFLAVDQLLRTQQEQRAADERRPALGPFELSPSLRARSTGSSSPAPAQDRSSGREPSGRDRARWRSAIAADCRPPPAPDRSPDLQSPRRGSNRPANRDNESSRPFSWPFLVEWARSTRVTADDQAFNAAFHLGWRCPLYNVSRRHYDVPSRFYNCTPVDHALCPT